VTVVIGLTGPIGCGKSTVAGWLGERPGVVVIDADIVAREVVEPGKPALDAVIVRFGDDLRRADGTLDRAALGRIVFTDPAALADLEAIVHPAVRPRILARIEQAKADEAAAVVIEAIKLVEGGLAVFCDEVWLVTCDAKSQVGRVLERGMGMEDAVARITAQGEPDERIRSAATHRIDTTGTIDETRRRVDQAFDSALRQRSPMLPAGSVVSQVRYDPHSPYVQFAQPDGVTRNLKIFVPFQIQPTSRDWISPSDEVGATKALQRLLGRSVLGIDERSGKRLELRFDGDVRLTIDARQDDADWPEPWWLD
jgi:dephospho-CoA kinase